MTTTKTLLNFSQAINAEFKNKPAPKLPNEKKELYQRIYHIGLEALSMMNRFPNEEKSLKVQVEAYSQLSETLKNVADYVTTSQTFWEYLKSLFFCGTEEEYVLQKALHQAQESAIIARVAQANTWLPADRQLADINPFAWSCYQFLGAETFRWYGWDPIEKFFKRDIDRVQASFEKYCSEQEEKQFTTVQGKIKLDAFKVLGNNRLKSDHLEGMDSSIAMKSVKRDLTGFINTFRNQFTPAEFVQLEKILHQLDRAIAICRKMGMAQSIYSMENPTNAYLPDDHPARKEFLARLADIAADIGNDIAQLSVGESTIVPGGYTSSKKGHAVLFKVTRDNETSYRFTVINTGAGAVEFENILSILGVVLQGKSSDYEIPDLTLDEVANPEFLQEIVRVKTDVIDGANAKTMFEPIIKYLAKGDVKKLRKGHEHGLQTNGTCSRSCVQAWLENALNNAIFKSYELFSTLTALKDLVSIQQKHGNDTEIANLQAEQAGVFLSSTLKGQDLLDTLIKLGSETTLQVKRELVELLDTKKAQLDSLKKELNFDVAKTQAEKHLKTWKKRENPEAFSDYKTRLDAKTDKLRTEFCHMAGQEVKPSLEPRSPNLFAKKDVKDKWEQYQGKKSKRENLLNQARTNPLFYSHARDQLVKIQNEIQALEQKKDKLDWETHNLNRCISILSSLQQA